MSVFRQTFGNLAGVALAILRKLHQPLNGNQPQLSAREMMFSIYDELSALATNFNSNNPHAALKVTVTQVGYGRPDHANQSSFGIRAVSGQFRRIILHTSVWAISVREKDNIVETFLLPATDLISLAKAETASRLKLRLEACTNSNGVLWTTNGFPIDDAEMTTLLHGLFKELIVRSRGDLELDTKLDKTPATFDWQSLTGTIQAMMKEKHALVQRVVSQQEEIQNRIARDIHDAVISDVMSLKRSFTGRRRMSDDQTVVILDEIALRLREICQDLTPRDLKDWGLAPVIKDLLSRLSERTGAKCVFDCPSEIPRLPEEVERHIFRIIQECLNNIEKHANANRIITKVKLNEHLLEFSVEDNGSGFDFADQSDDIEALTGIGASTMRERAELISAFYPANVQIQSEPAFGTKVMLQINFDGKRAG